MYFVRKTIFFLYKTSFGSLRCIGRNSRLIFALRLFLIFVTNPMSGLVKFGHLGCFSCGNKNSMVKKYSTTT